MNKSEEIAQLKAKLKDVQWERANLEGYDKAETRRFYALCEAKAKQLKQSIAALLCDLP